MSYPTPDEITEMRQAAEELLPQTATITKTSSTRVRTGSGGYEDAPAETVLASVKCRVGVSGLTPQERAIQERYTSETLWRIVMPAGTPIKASHRVTVDGVTYEVVAAIWHTPEITRTVIARELA